MSIDEIKLGVEMIKEYSRYTYIPDKPKDVNKKRYCDICLKKDKPECYAIDINGNTPLSLMWCIYYKEVKE